MTTNAELLAAITTIRNEVPYLVSHDPGLAGIGPAAMLLAKHVAGMLDETPLTVEWIDENTDWGDDSTSPYTRRYEIMKGIRVLAEACPGGFRQCEIWIGGGALQRRPATIGDLRRLAQALGIELREEPPKC